MKIAIPLTDGVLAQHFGHREEFALLDTNGDSTSIEERSVLKAPPHEPGLLPAWLAEKEVNLIIAGGMGQRARDMFEGNSISVVLGALPDTADNLAAAYLDGRLESGENACDH